MPTHAFPHQSRVPDEEDGCVVSDKVPVSILSVKLHCKPTRITHCVRTSRLTTCCMCGKMRKCMHSVYNRQTWVKHSSYEVLQLTSKIIFATCIPPLFSLLSTLSFLPCFFHSFIPPSLPPFYLAIPCRPYPSAFFMITDSLARHDASGVNPNPLLPSFFSFISLQTSPTYRQWKSGQPEASSCQWCRRVWPCNTGWCHGWPPSSQRHLVNVEEKQTSYMMTSQLRTEALHIYYIIIIAKALHN